MTDLDRPDYNPKAPHRTVSSDDVEHPREAFVDRLRKLGAAEDVMAAVTEHWDDPDWTDEREQVIALSDTALLTELGQIEREYLEGTHTEDEEAAAQRLAMEEVAAQILPENVPVVNAWVDTDPHPPARAVAVEALESQSDKPRETVMRHVAAVIASHDVDA